MKKLIVIGTVVLSLLAFNVSAATGPHHTHKYKHPSKTHKAHKLHSHHDPSYQN